MILKKKKKDRVNIRVNFRVDFRANFRVGGKEHSEANSFFFEE